MVKERTKSNEKSRLSIKNLRLNQTVIAKLSGRQIMKIVKKAWSSSSKGKRKKVVRRKMAFRTKSKGKDNRRVLQVISKGILIKIL